MPGMTLLEMTVVILVLLSIVSILFVGARAWLLGSNRATCIVQISMVQKAVRGYSNFYNVAPGANVVNLQSQIIGPNRFLEEMPVCPTKGVYTLGLDYGVDTIPPVGEVYMKCSLAVDRNHVPESASDW